MLALVAMTARDACGLLSLLGTPVHGALPLSLGIITLICYLRAVWADGAHADRMTRAVVWALLVIGAAHMAAEDPPDALGAPFLAGMYDLACCGLAAQCSCALLLTARGQRLAAAAGGFDERRLRVQAAGAFCFVGSIALRLWLGPSARGSTLESLLERAGTTTLSFAGWLLAYAPAPLPLDEDDELLEPMDREARLELNRRRREAREAKAAAGVAPLLRESWGLQGDVQGLEWARESLVHDTDGECAARAYALLPPPTPWFGRPHVPASVLLPPLSSEDASVPSVAAPRGLWP